jgi:hypothetical protein
LIAVVRRLAAAAAKSTRQREHAADVAALRAPVSDVR